MTEVKAPQINVATDFDGEPGKDSMGIGLPRDFLKGEPAHVCATIAMMAMQPHPERVQRYPQALATLALYAAGVAVTLTTRQFRMLERRVIKYLEIVGDINYCHTLNWQYADYVRERAVARARQEKLI